MMLYVKIDISFYICTIDRYIVVHVNAHLSASVFKLFSTYFHKLFKIDSNYLHELFKIAYENRFIPNPVKPREFRSK
jgi:hypothetical protein